MTLTDAKVNFRYLFKDIVQGFSEVKVTGTTLYVKHLSSLDQVDLEELEETFRDKAQKRELPTEEEALDRLREEDMWTAKDESEIIQQKLHVEALENTGKQLYLKSDIENNSTKKQEAQKKLAQLRGAKDDLVGQTCEKYAQSRVSDHYILKSFYKDIDLEQQCYSEEEMDELGKEELISIIQAYNQRLFSFTDDNIQKVILQDFYSAYFPFSDNVMNFYNKPLFELSLNQVKLIVFTRMFKNIFESYPKIPETIKKDPKKIIDYVNAQDKAKDAVSNLDKDGASTIVGAKPEDYEYLGYKQTPKGASLSEQLKKKGGRMNMKDLMETMG